MISYIFLTWLSPLVWKVFRRQIDTIKESDIWEVPDEAKLRKNTDRLKELWESELQSRGPENAHMQRTWRRFTKTRVLVMLLMTTVNAVAAFFSSAFLLYRIVSYLESAESDLVYGIGLTLAIAIAELVRTASITSTMLYGYETGLRFRNAFMGIMYDKLLGMRTIDANTKAEVISIFSVDSYRIYKLGSSLVVFCTIPPYVIIASVYCCVLIHYWALVAIATLLVSSLIQIYFSTLMKKFRKKSSTFSDKRIRRLREVMNSIKVIKMHAWEGLFTKRITEMRHSEQRYLFFSALVQCISASYVPVIPTLAAIITLSSYSAAGNALTAATAFGLVGTMNLLGTVVESFPFSLRLYVEATVSLKRLTRLLMLEDFKPPASVFYNDNNVIELQAADFAWDATVNNLPEDNKTSKTSSKRENIFVLNGINFEIKHGQLIGVCGLVGVGKSSLIAAIMGRMHQTSGHLAVKGSFAYAGQQAWILNATVKENILFGRDYDEKRFERVLDACCLLPDLRNCPAGADTEIGDQGSTLSGGQKQRVNIARAAYSNRDILLLDDPLSALDDNVGRRIFHECIKGLLRERTVILVTHQLQIYTSSLFGDDAIYFVSVGHVTGKVLAWKSLAIFKLGKHMWTILSYLNDCDQVVVMNGGRVVESGPHDVLVRNNGLYTDMFKAGAETSARTPVDTTHDSCMCNPGLRCSPKESTEIREKDVIGLQNHTGKLVCEEEYAVGEIGFSTYTGYIRAAGGWFAAAIVSVLFLASSGTIVFADWWLSQWVNNITTMNPYLLTPEPFYNTTFHIDDDERTSGSLENSTNTRFESSIIYVANVETYAIVYAALVPLLIVLQILVGWAAAKVLIAASNHLHIQCLTRILMAPISFFDVTPKGRILNRFTRDLDETDVHLPRTITLLLRDLSVLILSLLVAVLVSQWIILLLVPAVAMFVLTRMVSRRCIRQIKRLENITRSPVISQVNASTQGLKTIVAYGKEEFFTKRFEKYGDTSSMTTFLFDVSVLWAGVRLGLISAFMSIGSTLVCVLSQGVISPATAGLILGLCGKNISTIQFLTGIMNIAEARFSSVERLREYTDGLESELQMSKNIPSEKWPEKGAIVFQDVKMKYRPDSEEVLHSVSFEIRPQEKIGVVGRTGSGKSSLVAVLFRLVDITSGHILIDDVDVADLPLETLRSRISTIPQDPVLFSGTVRYNIDPFSIYTDEEIWLALARVAMKEKIFSMGNGLDSQVVEGGKNLSVGERQLFSLARAVLRNCKILVLDEATANVDTSTDARIQEILRTYLSNCTVITIAHRINTVLLCDRILVMDGGRVVEDGQPMILLADSQSVFNTIFGGADHGEEVKVPDL